MEDKPIYVTRAKLPPFEEYIEEIASIWESRWLTNMGSIHKKLELQLAQYLKTEHITLFTNGHFALELAIKSLGITGEVITTPFTFVSTVHAITNSGLTPVFCDIDPQQYTIDACKIEAAITEKTSAILPVHVYGIPCDVDAIEQIAQKYNLKVIYDAAHAFGVEINGRGIGSYGDMSMFSFHATKVFNTIEGGAVTCNDPHYAKRLDLLKNFGIQSQDSVSDIGVNAKMSEFQAAMGICNLRHIAQGIAERKQIVERYRSNLQGMDGLSLVKTQPGWNYSYCPLHINESVFGINRDMLFKKLEKHQIFPRKYFYPLISDMECYRHKFTSEKTPIARQTAQRIMTLPLYEGLAMDDVDRICEVIIAARQ